MSQPLETIKSEHVESLRVHIYGDDNPSHLNDYETFPYTVRVSGRWSSSAEVMTGECYSGVLDEGVVRWAWDEYRDDEEVIAYLKKEHGVIDVEAQQLSRDGDRWYLIATPDYLARAMAITELTTEARSFIRESLKIDALTMSEWCEGSVYRWELERERSGKKVYDDDGEEEPFTEWEGIESCGDYIGWDHVETEAREAMALAEEEILEERATAETEAAAPTHTYYSDKHGVVFTWNGGEHIDVTVEGTAQPFSHICVWDHTTNEATIDTDWDAFVGKCNEWISEQ